jgi:D-alanyl-D-alanine carboxypeptidase
MRPARPYRWDAGPAVVVPGTSATVLAVVLVVAALLAGHPHPVAALEPPPEPVLDDAPPGWPDPGNLAFAAYVLADGATGQVLAEQLAHTPRSVASTIKVLTALTVVERTDLDDEVTVGDEVLDVGGAAVGLEPGDTWTVEELLDALIARSGNEAAEALAVHVGGSFDGFLELMREDAAALGLGEPPLVSPSGLDDDNQLSAMDLLTIGRTALADDELRPILARETVDLPSVGPIESRNEFLLTEPDATGVKTGYTIAAGYSLIASAERDGRELVAVVLGAGEDPARFEAAGTLLDLGFEDFEPQTLTTEVTYGVAGGRVTLTVAPVEVTTPTGSTPAVTHPLLRPPEDDLALDVTVDEVVVGSVDAQLDRDVVGEDAEGPAALGRAAADGVYAALRAAAADQDLR